MGNSEGSGYEDSTRSSADSQPMRKLCLSGSALSCLISPLFLFHYWHDRAEGNLKALRLDAMTKRKSIATIQVMRRRMGSSRESDGASVALLDPRR